MGTQVSQMPKTIEQSQKKELTQSFVQLTDNNKL
jgi:hypothetical protein